MPSTKVTGLNVLAVYVSNLERARAFYVEQLGFEDAGEMPPGVLLKAGDVTLYIEAGREPRGEEARRQAEFGPCFATESVRASYEALRRAGVAVVDDYQELAPTFALFRVADPDGNVIEFAGEP